MRRMALCAASMLLLGCLAGCSTTPQNSQEQGNPVIKEEISQPLGGSEALGNSEDSSALSAADKEKMFAPYEQYGMTYDAVKDELTYNGNLVRWFEDYYPISNNETAGIDFLNENGTVDVYAVRDLESFSKAADGSVDPAGKLIGLKEFTQQEFDARDIEALKNSTSVAMAGTPLEDSETAKLVAEYETFGVTYDAEKDQWYFNGEEVRYFRDVLTSNGESLTSGKFRGEMRTLGSGVGTIDIYTVRDYGHLNSEHHGTLTGIEKYSQEEFDEHTQAGMSGNQPIGNASHMWGARMIHSILTNPTYTGDLAQGRSRVKSYKVHEVESVPREEWVEVAGTHESIIDYETFDKVQALLQRDTRTSPKGREVHLFSGFLKCADCGRAITRSVGNNNNVYYACSTYKNRSRTACTMHSIKHNRLEAAVLFAVQQQVHLAVSYSEMIARINTAPVKKSQSIRLEELIAAKERELAKISRYKQSLYQDWKDGEITQQDYRDMKADYERQIIALTDVLARLNAERAELANGVKSEHPALVAFTKHQNIDQLSRELLVELIDHIKVYENGNISVRFKFADEFRRIAEYIEINTTKPAVAG